jgi:hypothetical protein
VAEAQAEVQHAEQHLAKAERNAEPVRQALEAAREARDLDQAEFQPLREFHEQALEQLQAAQAQRREAQIALAEAEELERRRRDELNAISRVRTETIQALSTRLPGSEPVDINRMVEGLSLRLGALLLTLYLVHILVSYSRYHYRMSHQLASQANALDIIVKTGRLDQFEGLSRILATDMVDFSNRYSGSDRMLIDNLKLAVERIRS